VLEPRFGQFSLVGHGQPDVSGAGNIVQPRQLAAWALG